MINCKLFFLSLLASVSFMTVAQESRNFDFIKGSFREIDAKAARVSEHFLKEWPADVNGRDNVALIQIYLEHIPQSDVRNIVFENVGANAIICPERDEAFVKDGFLNIFVPAVSELVLVARLEGNQTNRYPLNTKLKHKGCYAITLSNNNTVSVYFNSMPEGAEVFMDESYIGKTPFTLAKSSMGTHRIRWEAAGNKSLEETVEITSNTSTLKRDLRPKKNISFSSVPSGATVIIDNDSEQTYHTPCTIPLTYQAHNIRMQKGDDQVEVFDVIVDEYLSPVYPTVTLVRKKEVEFSATYMGSKVAANLEVDNYIVGLDQQKYETALAYGKHKVRMSYQGNSKVEDIRIDENSRNYQLNITKQKQHAWPWDREYDTDPFGFSASYVQKEWTVSYYGQDIRYNPAWNVEKKPLNGVQFGIFYEPAFWFGLGIYTGVFYEYYYAPAKSGSEFSHTFTTEEYGDVTQTYDLFSEHSLYVPMHLYFRIPLANKVALKLHGGLGMDYGIYASYWNSDDDEVQSLEDYYKEESYGTVGAVYPKRFNLSTEAAGSLRVWNLLFNFQYSWGLTDHKLLDNSKSVMNKMTIGISYVFGND